MLRSVKKAEGIAALGTAELVTADFNDAKSIASDVPPEAMLQALVQLGLPNWQAEGLIEDYAHYKREEAASIASGVFDATATPPKSSEDFARDYAPAFS